MSEWKHWSELTDDEKKRVRDKYGEWDVDLERPKMRYRFKRDDVQMEDPYLLSDIFPLPDDMD